jgi:hypothetical protein
MLLALLAAALGDAATPPVAFKGGWQFGMNPGSALLVLAASVALMAIVYVCERRHAARAVRAEGVPPVVRVYQPPAFAQV